MFRQDTTSLKNLSQDKYKELQNTQTRAFREYLMKNTATCSMASEALDIPQKCLTRYKRDMEKSGQLRELMTGPCRVTGFRAAYLTTNPELFPPSPGEKIAGYFKRLFSRLKKQRVWK